MFDRKNKFLTIYEKTIYIFLNYGTGEAPSYTIEIFAPSTYSFH